MKIIGLTGSFGTGKTFVASIFASLGAKVVDADAIAHDVIARGKPAYKRIVRAFGERLLDGREHISRAKLAVHVFAKKGAVKKLNSIVHPAVIKVINDKIRSAGKNDCIVIDAPLLIETNLHKLADKLVVVKASQAKQIERCSKKFYINKKDVLKRIENQMSLRKKLELADFVIDNDGARSETRKQARKVWEEITWK